MIGLVGCAAQKLGRMAQARDLYDSPLFRASLTYAEARCERVYVLSAALELVDLGRWIMPYELRLDGIGGKKERQAWGARVASKLIARHGRAVDYLFLAGEDYAGRVATGLRTHDGHREDGWHGVRPERIHQPLAGMQIGQRLKWLNEQNAQLPRAPRSRRPWREVLGVGETFDELCVPDDERIGALYRRHHEAIRELQDALTDALEELERAGRERAA